MLNESKQSTRLDYRQAVTLKTVLAINVLMFLLEITVGLYVNSISLVADSLDMLGDALIYSFSLYAIYYGSKTKVLAAMTKGLTMMFFGLFVLGQAIYKIIEPSIPSYEAISFIGVVALCANTYCLFLLTQHQQEDINMRSVWLCSCNDVIANVLIIFAGICVWISNSFWPDCIVGLIIASLFFRTSFQIIQESRIQFRLLQLNTVNAEKT